MSALLAAFVTGAWMCTSPLTITADPLVPPLSPVTLTFSALADQTFAAQGQSLTATEQERVDWTGTWDVYDARLALIGAWQTDTGESEMRAFSSVFEADVLILNIRDEKGWGLPLRCLKQEDVS